MRVLGLRLICFFLLAWVEGLGFSGLGVQGLGFRLPGFKLEGIRFSALGFRDGGLGFRCNPSCACLEAVQPSIRGEPSG